MASTYLKEACIKTADSITDFMVEVYRACFFWPGPSRANFFSRAHCILDYTVIEHLELPILELSVQLVDPLSFS